MLCRCHLLYTEPIPGGIPGKLVPKLPHVADDRKDVRCRGQVMVDYRSDVRADSRWCVRFTCFVL